MASTPGDRILVVRLGAIGDALRVLPAVRRLRIERPAATLAWAVEDWVYPILAGNPHIDRFHVLSRTALRSGTPQALREMARFAREVRAARYDTVLDFHGRLKSGLVTRSSGAATRVGYARGQCTEGNHLFTNLHVTLDDPLENRVLRFLHLLSALGIDAAFDPSDTGLWISTDVIARAHRWYEESGEPMVAAYPGTSTHQSAYHRWPAEKWAEMLGQLGAAGITSTVFWGPDEGDYARAIVAAVPAGARLAPATTLTEMMAMLARYRAFVGSNTAATHMAWLQGVPTAFFVGPAAPRTDAPLPPVPSRCLQASDRVARGRSKRHQAAVVHAVSVATARAAVEELLTAASHPRGSLPG
jgi:ADP-heptose:LPS heptosyltransferase